MKKAAGLILTLVVSNSSFATDLDTITQNVKSVCQSPSQAGKYWNVTATGKADATGSIRLASVGVNGEATFTKGEWEGVQQVLKAQQSADNANYRDCAIKLTPLFLANFAKATPVAKSATAIKSAPVPAPAESSKTPPTIGNVTGDQNVTGNATGDDMNINFDVKP